MQTSQEKKNMKKALLQSELQEIFDKEWQLQWERDIELHDIRHMFDTSGYTDKEEGYRYVASKEGLQTRVTGCYSEDENIFKRFQGTVLPGLLTRPSLWIVVTVFVTTSLCTGLYEDTCGAHLGDIPVIYMSVVTKLMTMLLTFFTGICFRRFRSSYKQLKKIENHMRAIASLMTDRIPLPLDLEKRAHVRYKQLECLRLLAAAYYMAFAHLYDGDRFKYSLQGAFDLGLITQEEGQKISQYQRWERYQELLVFADLLINECDDEDLLPPWIIEVIQKQILEIGLVIDDLLGEYQMPVPFLYYHMLTVLNLLGCIGIAYSLAGPTVQTPRSMSWVIFLVEMLGYLGMRELGIQLINPYGDMEMDLPVDMYIKNLLESVSLFLTSESKRPRIQTFQNGEHMCVRQFGKNPSLAKTVQLIFREGPRVEAWHAAQHAIKKNEVAFHNTSEVDDKSTPAGRAAMFRRRNMLIDRFKGDVESVDEMLKQSQASVRLQEACMKQSEPPLEEGRRRNYPGHKKKQSEPRRASPTSPVRRPAVVPSLGNISFVGFDPGTASVQRQSKLLQVFETCDLSGNDSVSGEIMEFLAKRRFKGSLVTVNENLERLASLEHQMDSSVDRTNFLEYFMIRWHDGMSAMDDQQFDGCWSTLMEAAQAVRDKSPNRAPEGGWPRMLSDASSLPGSPRWLEHLGAAMSPRGILTSMGRPPPAAVGSISAAPSLPSQLDDKAAMLAKANALLSKYDLGAIPSALPVSPAPNRELPSLLKAVTEAQKKLEAAGPTYESTFRSPMGASPMRAYWLGTSAPTKLEF